MSILDAMGYGLPVVSTDVGGIPKIVHEGENGFCCESGDTESMADVIIKMLCDRSLLENMSKKSLDVVKEGYSLERHIDLIEEIYNL